MTETRAATQAFPVVWEHPDDERLSWRHDRMHWPDPLPVLMLDMPVEAGFSRAVAEFDMPMRLLSRRMNTYFFSSMSPVPVPADEAEARATSAEQKMADAVTHLGERWQRQWLPEIKQHHAFWDSFDRCGAAMPTLLDHLDESLRRLERIWHIHFLIVLPAHLAVSQLDDLYQELFSGEGALAAYRLVQGLENKSIEVGRGLWALSRRALAAPTVARVIAERASAEVIPALEASAEGRAFLAEFCAYLELYGQRGQSFATLADLSWIEDPTPAIKSLKDLIAQPRKEFDAERAALAAEREQALAETRRRLAGYPAAVRDQFEKVLEAAHHGALLGEDHAFWIDYASVYKVRRVFLEFGRRFAEAGVLEAPTDIVHLRLDEIKATAAALPRVDQRDVVAARKAEMVRWAAVRPPATLGAPPSGPPPDSPMTRSMGRFFGHPPPPSTDPSVLAAGTAGSPGRVRGIARVVRSLADAARLGNGEILVAETTAPPWTPLFASAGAVVTDTGGVLSHCAVVAREYGIPAVVGTGTATRSIKDGQDVEVDGDAGIVRVVAKTERNGKA